MNNQGDEQDESGLILRTGSYMELRALTSKYNRNKEGRILDVDHRPNYKLWSELFGVMKPHLEESCRNSIAASSEDGLETYEKRALIDQAITYVNVTDSIDANGKWLHTRSPCIILPHAVHKLTRDFAGKNARGRGGVQGLLEFVGWSPAQFTPDMLEDDYAGLKAKIAHIITEDFTALAKELKKPGNENTASRTDLDDDDNKAELDVIDNFCKVNKVAIDENFHTQSERLAQLSADFIDEIPKHYTQRFNLALSLLSGLQFARQQGFIKTEPNKNIPQLLIDRVSEDFDLSEDEKKSLLVDFTKIFRDGMIDSTKFSDPDYLTLPSIPLDKLMGTIFEEGGGFGTEDTETLISPMNIVLMFFEHSLKKIDEKRGEVVPLSEVSRRSLHGLISGFLSRFRKP